MCMLCAAPSVKQSIGSFSTWRERPLATSTDSEWSKCESEDEASDSVNTNTSGSISGKRSRSSSSPSSTSSSPDVRPTKRPCVASALPTTEPASPGSNGTINASAPGNDTSGASAGCLSRGPQPADLPPHLRTDIAPLREINIYFDGSVLGNGKPGARAGWGAWYEEEDVDYLGSGRVHGANQTSSRAELTAAIEGLRKAPLDVRLILNTDSLYVMGIMDRLPKWKSNGFRKCGGGPVANQDLVLQLEGQIDRRWGNVEWKHVKAHSGVYGNEMADRLAKQGASMPLREPSL